MGTRARVRTMHADCWKGRTAAPSVTTTPAPEPERVVIRRRNGTQVRLPVGQAHLHWSEDPLLRDLVGTAGTD